MDNPSSIVARTRGRQAGMPVLQELRPRGFLIWWHSARDVAVVNWNLRVLRLQLWRAAAQRGWKSWSWDTDGGNRVCPPQYRPAAASNPDVITAAISNRIKRRARYGRLHLPGSAGVAAVDDSPLLTGDEHVVAADNCH